LKKHCDKREDESETSATTISLTVDESYISKETIECYARKAKSILDGTYEGHKKDASFPPITKDSIIYKKFFDK